MAKINVLTKQVTDLIAAGEVVERPASVVKELLENSIDAGAKNITVEIQSGGIKLIRITDDGSGIEKDDIKTAFISHATSKIKSAGDLDEIITLGFRGEALASVAAISSVELLTRTPSDDIGFRYCISGGEETDFEEAGCPFGTTIVVRDLFYNVPARMKFLKKDVSEGNTVSTVVERLALSHPEVSIKYIKDGKQILASSGDGKLSSTIREILGKDFFDGLLYANAQGEGISVDGYISKPSAARQNRAMQYFFLNGRYIKTQTGSAALGEAFKNSIGAGKFPACVLNITINPAIVDVNVHPAKIEVRFANEREVFSAVYHSVKNALFGGNNISEKPTRNQTAGYLDFLDKTMDITPVAKQDIKQYISPTVTPTELVPQKTDSAGFIDYVTGMNQTADYNSYKPAETLKNPDELLKSAFSIKAKINSESTPVPLSSVPKTGTPESQYKQMNIDIIYDDEDNFPPKASNSASQNSNTFENIVQEQQPEDPEELERLAKEAKDRAVKAEAEKIKVIGEAFKTYIIVQKEDKLIIIDKHAAHERIIFNRLKKEHSAKTKQLMMPLTVVLSKEEYAALMSNTDLLDKAGYGISDFGQDTVIINECPLELGVTDIAGVVKELAGYLLDNRLDMTSEKLDKIYNSTACRAAIKAGDFTSDYELRIFVAEVLSSEDVRYCPHGRPVMFEISKQEMEKNFGRA